LLKPANEFVIASIPVTTMEQREEYLELKVVGTVGYDTRQAGVISSRVGGRIEKLYIRYKYQPIKKGQRVMDIYSPELMTAQQNLLFVLKNDPGNSSLISATKERLQLMGMTSMQVAELIRSRKAQYSIAVYSQYGGFATELNKGVNNVQAEAMQGVSGLSNGLSVKEGMYVQSGQAVFSVYDPSKAWILLDIFPEQQALISKGNAVRIVPETAPHQNFRAQVDYLEPIFRPGVKTLSARVHFNNAQLQLPIGSRVTATIFSSSKSAAWLSREALLSLGREKIVFRMESGGFRAHKVVTGIEVNRSVQIISGLSAGDSVAANAQFLIDNQAFIKIANE
jgi:Cu(I)/Ag(I) efflux system membrane fusion protein